MLSCKICLREISPHKTRKRCINCICDDFCDRCMIYSWCRNCYFNKDSTCSMCNTAIKGKRTICTSCGGNFCDKCGIHSSCKHCFIKNESDSLIRIIANVRKDISTLSISIIADYCIGYIVQCCNQRENCPNKILFENKYEFKTNNAFYKYAPKHNKANTVRIYMMDLRIFCIFCTNNKLNVCLNKYGAECNTLEICGDNEYQNICGNHKVCTNCNQRELIRESKRPKMRKILRRWIYYTAQSTEISKCIMCNNDFCRECIKYNNIYCKKCAEEYNKSFLNMISAQKRFQCVPNPPITNTCTVSHKITYNNAMLTQRYVYNECDMLYSMRNDYSNRGFGRIYNESMYNPALNIPILPRRDTLQNYISLDKKRGTVYDVVDNERKRGSKQYKEECIAKLKIGRAPVITSRHFH